MNKSKVKNALATVYLIFIFITLGFINFVTFDIGINETSVQAATIYVDSQGGGNYTSIQAAIDNASSGDTIIVANGTYYESVTINKSNIKLMGNSTTDCKIIHYFEGTNYLNDFAAGINITAPNVNITGFNISVSGNYTFGICLNSSSSNSNITNNNISTTGNQGYGILLYQSLNNIVKNNTINTSGQLGGGIYLYESSYNNLINNFINTSGQNGVGILLILNSNNNNLTENTINTSGQSGGGIYIRLSSSINLTYNIINVCYGWGIHQMDSNKNNLTGNIINASGDSIWLDSTKSTNLSGNNMTRTGIAISGNSIDHWNSHAIDTLNLVYTKPVYYYSDTNGVTVPSDVGEVIIANCTNMNVSNRNFNYGGVLMGFSENSEVIDNTFTFCGIDLYYSNNNNLTNNNIRTTRKSMFGIYLLQSMNNNLTSNTINTSGDHAYGIRLYESSNNDLIYNTINTTGEQNFGINLYGASNNNEITNNKIKTTGEYGCGIRLVGDMNQMYGPSDNNFKCNNITTYGESGWGISQGDQSKNNKFINNNISTYGQYGWGIKCGGGGGCTNHFIDNSIKTYGERGYGIHKAGGGNYLTGNTIITYGERGDGIYDNMGGGIILNNHITTTGGGYGIFTVNMAEGSKIIGNYINTTGAYGHGIYLYRNGNYNDVIDNIVNVNGQNSHGIRLRRKAKYNNIIGNTVNTSEQSGYGIYLHYIVNNNVLINNIINSKGVDRHGIYINDSANNNVLTGNIINTSGVGGHGISIADSVDTFVSNCNITTTNTSAYGFCLNGNSAIITNSTITTASGSKDFKAINDGEITAINCSFKSVQVTQNGGGVLKVKNYLDVQVIGDDGITPISGVDVEVRDNNLQTYGTSGFSGSDNTTNAYGRIGQITVTDRVYNHNNFATENVTTIKVKKMFDELWEVERPDVDMSTSHTEIFYHDVTAPSIPTGLKVIRIPGINSLNISWDLNQDTVKYILFSNKTGQWEILNNVMHPQNWTLEEDLPDKTRYYYKIKALDKVDLSSELSEAVSYYLIDITPPVIPSGLAVKPVPGGDALNISWDLNPDNPLYYDIAWEDPVSDGWTWLDNVSHPKNWYILSYNSLVNGTTYYFKIKASYQGFLSSVYTAPVGGIHRDHLAPEPPLNPNAEAFSETIIKLNWLGSNDLDIEGYRVYMNESGTGSGGPYILLAEVNTLSHKVTNLLENTAYYFVISAYDEANNTSPFSKETWTTTLIVPEHPRVVSTIPIQNSSDIAITTSIIVIFNVSMNILTVEKVFDISPFVQYDLSWLKNNTELQIDLIKNLSYNTSYVITIGLAKSETGFVLEDHPFILQFKTIKEKKVKPQIFTFTILYPTNGTIVKPGEKIDVSGTSQGYENGTLVSVALDTITRPGTIDINGNWSVSIKVPVVEGNYIIEVKIGDLNDSMSLTVKDGEREDAETADNGDEDKGIFGMKTIVGLMLFLVLVIIIVIIILVMVRKKKVSEKTEKEKKEEWEDEE